MSECSVIHGYLYGLIKRNSHGQRILSRKQINEQINRLIRIPNKSNYAIIREMKKCGFLNELNHDAFEVLEVKGIKPPKDGLNHPLW